jgi:hypothetical protein
MGGRGAGCVSGGAGAGFATDLQKGREVAAVAVMQGPHVSLRRLRLGPATSGARSLGGPPAAQIRHRTTAGRDFTHFTLPSGRPYPRHANTMSSIIARSAFRAAPRLRAAPAARRWASAAAAEERESGKQALKTGAKRDPELYVCRGLPPGRGHLKLMGCHRSSWSS